MSDAQYPATKLVTDEILNRITSESTRLERRRVEVQETHRALTKKEGDVEKQVALLEQVKQDMRGKSAEILSLDAAATRENRALASRERAVAPRESEMDRREDEFAELELELREAKKELWGIIPMFNEQLDAYKELEEKHQQSRERYGRLEVDHRLLKTQSSRYEKEAKSLSTRLQKEQVKNFDLIRKNAELAEHASYYKSQLSKYRGSPMPEAPSPTLSVATTNRITPATRKPSGSLASTPVWARSTIASRARSSISPPQASTFASSSDRKIRGTRNDGLSTSFNTASPAVRIPSRAVSEVGVSLAPSAKSSADGDVSPLLLPGTGSALNDRQQRRQQLFKARVKADSYTTTPITAAARDKFHAEQAELKFSSSKASDKSVGVISTSRMEGPETPVQNNFSGVLDSSDLSYFSNVGNAFEAGSPEKDDDELTPKANAKHKRDDDTEGNNDIPRKPVDSKYQKSNVKDDDESSSLLDDTLISGSFDLPGPDLSKREIARPSMGPGALKRHVQKRESAIDINMRTEQKMAISTAKKGGATSKRNGEQKETKAETRADGTDYMIKSKCFL